jgi:peptide/nickel transport system permease protein
MTGPFAATFARALRNPSARFGLLVLAVIGLAALLAPRILPDPAAMPSLATGATPPSWSHPFGTDQLNRDVLSRVAHGARISLGVALIATALSLTLGVAVGVVAGYYGRWLDSLLMRAVDAALAIPRLFILLLLLVVWNRVPLPALIFVIGATGWFATSRLVRSEVVRRKQDGYVQAAAALGANAGRTIFRHLVPNVLGVILVTATLGFGEVILLEAGLSFLGVGVQPPTPSWGSMVQDAETRLTSSPWTFFFPGFAILVTVMAINLVSDALRAAFDPRSA